MSRALSENTIIKLFFIKYFSNYKARKLQYVLNITRGVWPMVKTSWILFRIISWITFVKIKTIGNYSSYFHFCTKNSFLYENFRYENYRYNLQWSWAWQILSRDFNHRSDTLRNINANGTVTFMPYNSKSTLLKNNFIIEFWKALDISY